MQIVELCEEHLPEAAALFCARYRQLRRATPALPGLLENESRVSSMLELFLPQGRGLAALQGGRLAGYLGWFLADHFRETQRKGAYVPEWAHAVLVPDTANVYGALYRAASTRWVVEGVGAHAISLLANDRAGRETWFWNGFGLMVVDAVRAVFPLDPPAVTQLGIRRACLDDAPLLSALDAEHWAHYTRPPVLMAPQEPLSATGCAEQLARSGNSVWLALDGERPVGFLRFEAGGGDACAVVEADTTVAITGAYVRPPYRGLGAMAALLDTALGDYLTQGYGCCAVDFESFNPEAARFWMKYFQPVCYSLLRIPENAAGEASL
ncbi:MAG: GNAT family N-acetyltransferase [Anaerolineaceae bacterium]|nr:GNAT family N-acetyltransferase [Anaerolineaceae bacterium]